MSARTFETEDAKKCESPTVDRRARSINRSLTLPEADFSGPTLRYFHSFYRYEERCIGPIATQRGSHPSVLHTRQRCRVSDVCGEREKLIKSCFYVKTQETVDAGASSHVRCINIHVSFSSPPGTFGGRRRLATGARLSTCRFPTVSRGVALTEVVGKTSRPDEGDIRCDIPSPCVVRLIERALITWSSPRLVISVVSRRYARQYGLL